jgi:1-acyl-sn-glycerol-3-phosphate acyltransferase
MSDFVPSWFNRTGCAVHPWPVVVSLPAMLNRWLTSLRFWTRMLAFVLGTIAFWAAMEIDFLLHGRKRRIDLVNKWVARWAGTLLWIFGIRVEARGPFANEGRLYPGRDERGIGHVFISNHRSGADIPVAFTVVEAHVISRHDLAHWPLIGAGARRIGTLFVDRASRRSGATVLKQIAESLEVGEGIAMFPEGTAFPGDEVREFKPGAFKAAQRAGAMIIPLGIAYDDPAAYYTDESFMGHMKRIASMKRLRVAVEIGEPLAVDRESAVELKDHARERVEELVLRARHRLEGRKAPQPTPSLASS